tara:strand:- start:134 stop:853 length:720 start_codon:yes stop_codon:yes gene_type:complete
MSLQNHIDIFFKDLKIDDDIDFKEIWFETYDKINFNKKKNLYEISNYIRIIKNFYLCQYFLSTDGLNGDVLECGVLRGFSAYLINTLEKKITRNHNNNFYLIDSFEGFDDFNPEDSVIDGNIHQHKKGDLSANFEEVQKIFENIPNVNLLKGWIPDIFDSLDENNQYRFVHIDVDLYKPTLSSLNYIYDKVIKGGVIITDDYNSPLFPGNQKAWIEFFKSKNNSSYLVLPSGQAALIKQ